MKIMYVAPRFHTNQIPIVKGWIKEGDEVCFISQFVGGTEDYSVIKPVVLGYAKISYLLTALFHLIQKLRKRYRENNYEFQIKMGFLPKRKFIKILNEFSPDVVIMRDRSCYNVAVTKICEKRNIKCILYTQTPLWQDNSEKQDFIRQYFRENTPSLRMTPVLGKVEDADTHVKEGSFYVPFVIEPEMSYEIKSYTQAGPVRFLDVGKYEKRKHHEYLLQFALEHKETQDVHVTIVGEAVTKEQSAFLEGLKSFVKENEIEAMVTFKKNLTREEIDVEYKAADVFLLPSTGEFASISQLEAMAYSLPVIVSDTNGTSCYVEQNGNGYIFEDNNYEDFKKSAELLLDRKRIATMGKRSYELVVEVYNFQKYKEAVLEMLKE